MAKKSEKTVYSISVNQPCGLTTLKTEKFKVDHEGAFWFQTIEGQSLKINGSQLMSITAMDHQTRVNIDITKTVLTKRICGYSQRGYFCDVPRDMGQLETI